MENSKLTDSDLSQSKTYYKSAMNNYHDKVGNRLYTKSHVSNIKDVKPTMPGLIDIEYIVNADLELDSEKNELDNYLREQNEELMRFYQRGIGKNTNGGGIVNPILTSPVERLTSEENTPSGFTSNKFSYQQYQAIGKRNTNTDLQQYSTISDMDVKESNLMNFALAKESNLYMSQTFCENLQTDAVRYLFDKFPYWYVDDEFDTNFNSEGDSIHVEAEPEIAKTVHQSSLPQVESHIVSNVHRKISGENPQNNVSKKFSGEIGLSYTDMSESININSFQTNKYLMENKTKLNQQSYLTNKYIDQQRISEKEEFSPHPEHTSFSKNHNDDINSLLSPKAETISKSEIIFTNRTNDRSYHSPNYERIDTENIKMESDRTNQEPLKLKWNQNIKDTKDLEEINLSLETSEKEIALRKRSSKSIEFQAPSYQNEIEDTNKGPLDNKKRKLTIEKVETDPVETTEPILVEKPKSKSLIKKTIKFADDVDDNQIPVIFENGESPSFENKREKTDVSPDFKEFNLQSDLSSNASPYSKSFNLEMARRITSQNAEKEQEDDFIQIKKESILVNADVESNRNFKEHDTNVIKSVKFDDSDYLEANSKSSNTNSQSPKARISNSQQEHIQIDRSRKQSIATVDKCFMPDEIEKKIVESFADQPSVFLIDTDLEQETKHQINKRLGNEPHHNDNNLEKVHEMQSILKSNISKKIVGRHNVDDSDNYDADNFEEADIRKMDDTAVSVRSKKSIKFVDIENDQLLTASNFEDVKKLTQEANNNEKIDKYVKLKDQMRDVNLVKLEEFEEGKTGEFMAMQAIDDELTFKDEKSIQNVQFSLQGSDSEDAPPSIHDNTTDATKFVQKAKSLSCLKRDLYSKSILHNNKKNYDKSLTGFNENPSEKYSKKGKKNEKRRMVEFTQNSETQKESNDEMKKDESFRNSVGFVDNPQIVEDDNELLMSKNVSKQIDIDLEKNKSLNDVMDFGYNDDQVIPPAQCIDTPKKIQKKHSKKLSQDDLNDELRDNLAEGWVKTEESMDDNKIRQSITSPHDKKIIFYGQEGVVNTEEDLKAKQENLKAKQEKNKKTAKERIQEDCNNLIWIILIIFLIYLGAYNLCEVIQHLATSHENLPLITD